MFTIQETSHNGHPTLRLAGELTIYSASTARTSLAVHLDAQPGPPTLDLADLEEIDTAGIQVLLWFKREARARGKVLPFVNHSPAVIEAFDLLRITDRFDDSVLLTPRR
jgi:anti-sigma B factor antagonist